MNIKTYNNISSDEKKQFFDYLKIVSHLPDKAILNIWSDDWDRKPNTLPYQLEKGNRFNSPNGEFYIAYIDNNPIAFGGVYKSSFSDFIGIAGVRTFVDVNYRNQSILRDTLLPLHKKWCIEKGLKIVLLTFNEYNKNLIKVFQKRRFGETLDRIKTRQPHHLFYSNCNEIGFSINVQYTEQYGLYEKLDNNFNFDWETIKWT